MSESFQNSIAALKERVTEPLNVRPTTPDLNYWIMEQLSPRASDSILDLGAGNGKRTLRLAKTRRDPGYVLVVDRSYEALRVLSRPSIDAGTVEHLRFAQTSLDELDGRLRPNDYERILGSRVLSQVRHPRKVFYTLAETLKPDGIFFFYGPSRKNNVEMKRFVAELRGEGSEVENHEPTFIEGLGVQTARATFTHVLIVKFEQTLRLETPELLYNCWSASNLYHEALDKPFRQAARRHFEKYRVFETTQRIIGIKAAK